MSRLSLDDGRYGTPKSAAFVGDSLDGTSSSVKAACGPSSHHSRKPPTPYFQGDPRSAMAWFVL
jgi:hypothetical protein